MARSGRGRRPRGSGREFLVEFRRIGNAVKVSAIDPVTGTEVSISGPANIGETELSRTACNKLRYVLRKNSENAAAAQEARRRGIKI